VKPATETARGRICLRFMDYDVTVVSSMECVLRRVASGFRQMLHSDAPASSLELEIRRGHQYDLLRNGELLARYSDLFEAKTVLRHEINRAFIHAHPQFLWMHAGAAAGRDCAALFVGISGRGKSTLITTLCRQGLRYLSDDIIPIDPVTGTALPYPMTPIIREDIGQELPSDRIEELSRTLVELPTTAYCRVPVDIGTIVLPSYSAKTRAQVLPFAPGATALDLVRQCINARVHGASAVKFMAELTASVPVLPIQYSDADSAADLVSSRLN
jgi:hypothetical protein